MIREAKDLTGEITETVDVVVVGSGAAGAPFAYKMAQAGKSVLILEAGGYYTSTDFTEREGEMSRKLYVDGAGQGNADGSVGVFQGKCVGGSTVINGMMCFRPPARVLEHWRSEYGVTGLSYEELLPSIEEVERTIDASVNEPHEINANNRLFMQGAEKLGWRNAPVWRNKKQCAVSGFCMQGCAYDRKRSMLVTYIPLAVELGATLYADTEVDTVAMKKGRATGLRATVRDRDTGEAVASLTVHAKVVALAAGAIQTPCILQRSKLGRSSKELGKNLAIHPGPFTVAVFDRPVNNWAGAIAGAYVDEFHEHEKGGFLLEGNGLGPMGIGTAIGRSGALQRALMRDLTKMTTCLAVVHDPGCGSVQYDAKSGKAKIEYELDAETQERVKLSVKRMADIWFAAGASKVIMPFTKELILESADEVDKIDAMSAAGGDIFIAGPHPQGTARMGADPKRSVVDPHGEVHDAKGVFVVDTSAFPTSIDVNPQISTMSIATHRALQILADPKRFYPRT